MILLVVDDEPAVRASIRLALKSRHEVLEAGDADSAWAILERKAIDLVVSDQKMPGRSGMELLEQAKRSGLSCPFLIMTAHGSVEEAVEAIRLGADDYLLKPFEMEDLIHRVDRAAKIVGLAARAELLQASRARTLIGESQSIRDARAFAAQVSGVDTPVLLLGPSGSGKEVLARSIHESGKRAQGPFVAVNCASLGEQLLESELFGHEKGAFTGATAAKPGKFELARGGTILLDEVGELTPAVQARLLRVLQESEFYRVGGTRIVKSDARVLAATHQPLRQRVAEGAFREDLFFRLNVIAFELAPLSRRADDIPLLIDFFWERISRKIGAQVSLPPETRSLLVGYSYPGNVRELQNAIERLIVLGQVPGGKGIARLELLPAEYHSPASGVPSATTSGLDWTQGLDASLDRIEARAIQEALEQSRGNQARAAELLKITRGGLQYKMRKHGLIRAA